MQSWYLVALNGVALGLASTLHCAGMCGAISCSLMLAQERGGVRSAQAAFALTHLGRIIAYATAGAVVGFAGAPAIAWMDREAAFRLLQWAGAVSHNLGRLVDGWHVAVHHDSRSRFCEPVRWHRPRRRYSSQARACSDSCRHGVGHDAVRHGVCRALHGHADGLWQRGCDHHGGVRRRHATGTDCSQLRLSTPLCHPRARTFCRRLGHRRVRHRDRVSRASYRRAALPYRQPAGSDHARHSDTASG